jgi:hypothetical protein
MISLHIFQPTDSRIYYVLLMLIQIMLQVYPCNRRGIQPTFGCLFPYLNVQPLRLFIHHCLGNCVSYTLKICVIIGNVLLKNYK